MAPRRGAPVLRGPCAFLLASSVSATLPGHALPEPSDVLQEDQAQCLLQVTRAQARRDNRTQPLEEWDSAADDKTKAAVGEGQRVHWVLVSDCSAYMFNQGNLMLESAHHVGQPGEFTWIVYGCDREEQRAELAKIGHPRARVWHVASRGLTNPRTGKPYKDFQASNRPLAVLDWWRGSKPQEEAIGILDPDEFFMRPVHLVDKPRDEDGGSYEGPWEVPAAVPKRGSAATYGLGCQFTHFGKKTLHRLCGGEESCMHMASDAECLASYSSGPPWVLHRDDAEQVFGSWLDTAILTHESWPNLLAEQVSFGITQARFQVRNSLNPFWFLSSPDNAQPWSAVLNADYEPCMSREPPPTALSLPPLWHACSTWQIPHLQGQHFVLHKDHIHKDLLDCNAPLIHFPPRDALQHYYGKKSSSRPVFQPTDRDGFIQTWAVCTYTNLVNFHAASWKKRYCKEPELRATFAYPDHSQSFLNSSSTMERIFRRGGWQDVDYRVGAA